jgi:hypothetical protein
MRSYRRVLWLLILVALLPVLGPMLATVAAGSLGCLEGDLLATRCLAGRYDIRDGLETVRDAAWLGLFGLPVAGGLTLLWIVAELAAGTIGRSSRILRR